jgi:hypothetical protein
MDGKCIHPGQEQPTEAWNELVLVMEILFWTKIKRKLGTFYYMHSPIKIEKWNTWNVVGVHTEIHEQKTAEKKLKESEEAVQAL